MRVLIIGYGKIGRIKAPIWQALGATVYVYEQSTALHPKILKDGYDLFKSIDPAFDIIDISTPAGAHYKALAWALDITSESSLYLVEKPLASTQIELEAFKSLLTKKPDLIPKIVVNESYYQSSLINKVVEDIDLKNAKIQSIHIELSKNRLKDLEAGRFFDVSMESIGLEVPHMLAILDRFDVALPTNTKASLIVDKDKRANQAFILRTDENIPKLLLESYMGDFRYDGSSITSNMAATRKVVVATNILDYQIEFDPLFNYERFYGKLTILDHGEVLSNEYVLDNHLSTQLRLVANGTSLQKTSIGAGKAMKITETLLHIRETCEVTEITPHDNSVRLNKDRGIQWL